MFLNFWQWLWGSALPAPPNAVPYIHAYDKNNKVTVSDPRLIHQAKSFVAFMGPPGSGKSTLCNTFLHCKYGSRQQLFDPSDSSQSYTKGVWVLSPEARMQLSGRIDQEPLDMEGFGTEKERCWKMAMVMCIMAEVVVFCNRDARYDTVYNAAMVLQRGIDLAKDLGMRAVTSQVFVPIKPCDVENEEKIKEVVTKVKTLIPGIEIMTFTIPEVGGPSNKFDNITFHGEVVKAVREELVQQFRFNSDSEAACSKSGAVCQLLEAFNTGDLTKCGSCSLKFLEVDCKRIYDKELCKFKQEHRENAEKLSLASIDTTLEQFMGNVSRDINPKFEESTFFIKDRSERHIASWYSGKVEASVVSECYEPQYKAKMSELHAKEAEERAKSQQDEYEFLQLVSKINNDAKLELAKFISGMRFRQTYVPSKESFLHCQGLSELQARVTLTADHAPFYTYYEAQCKQVAAKWESQITNAQWKEPVQAQGEMRCQGGCTLRETVVCHSCKGQLYWVDGPARYTMCQGCLVIDTIGDELQCSGCKKPSLCKTRPSNYFP